MKKSGTVSSAAVSVAAGLAIWVATFALTDIFESDWRTRTQVTILLALTTFLLAGARWVLTKLDGPVASRILPPLVGLIGATWFVLTSIGSPASTYAPVPDGEVLHRVTVLLPHISAAVAYGTVPLAINPPMLFAVTSLVLALLIVTDALAHSRFPLLAVPGLLLFLVPAIGLGFGVPVKVLVATVAAVLVLIALTNPSLGLANPRLQLGSNFRAAWKPALLGVVAAAIAIVPSAQASTALGERLIPQRFFPIHEAQAVGFSEFKPSLAMNQRLQLRTDEPLFRYTTTFSDDWQGSRWGAVQNGQDVGLLRFGTYSIFDGQTWSAFGPKFGSNRNNLSIADGGETGLVSYGRQPRATVVFTIESLAGSTLPLLGNERSIASDGLWNFDTANDVAKLVDNFTPGTQFTLGVYSQAFPTAYGPNLRWDDLAGNDFYSDIGTGNVRPQHLEVPAADQEYLTQIANSIVSSAFSDPFYAALELQRYLRSGGGFTYTLEPPSGGSTNIVRDFLTQRNGYCMHFASTMVLLSRSLGIPARLAVGFQPGQQTADGEWVVTAQDTHSWAELYFGPLFGWLPFDPTPPTDLGRTTTTFGASNSVYGGEYSEQARSDHEDQYLFDEWAAWSAAHNYGGSNVNDATANSDGLATDSNAHWLVLVLSLIGGLLLLSVGGYALHLHRLGRLGMPRVGCEEFALTRAAALLRRHGVTVDPGCTPRQLPDAAAVSWKAKYRTDPPAELVNNLQKITKAVEQTRYAGSGTNLNPSSSSTLNNNSAAGNNLTISDNLAANNSISASNSLTAREARFMLRQIRQARPVVAPPKHELPPILWS